MIFNKVNKLIHYIRNYDVYKSLKWYFRLKLPRTASFHIYPNSIVDISKKSRLNIEAGEFAINASWFKVRSRRYKSELRICEDGELVVKGNFHLYQGASIHVAEGAKLVLGKNSFLNTNSTLNCFKSIQIGDNCAISDNVSIHDSDSHILNGKMEEVSKPVIIKNHVWIGKNVTILKGVIIGNGVVIGAGSIVTKDIPDNCLAIGNPAKVIKENIKWE